MVLGGEPLLKITWLVHRRIDLAAESASASLTADAISAKLARLHQVPGRRPQSSSRTVPQSALGPVNGRFSKPSPHGTLERAKRTGRKKAGILNAGCPLAANSLAAMV